MSSQSLLRWKADDVPIGSARIVVFAFTHARSRVRRAELTATPSRGAGLQPTVVELEVRGSHAIGELPASFVDGFFDMQLDARGDDGRALLAAVLLVTPDPSAPAQPQWRAIGVAARPDWVADAGALEARFGVIGARRREAFSAPVYEGPLPIGLAAGVGLVDIAVAFFSVDVDAERAKALKTLCKAGDYFAEIERRTAPPEGQDDLPKATLTNLRDKVEDRLVERAVYGAKGKRWKPYDYDVSTKLGLEIFAKLVTEVFEKAESHLVGAVGTVSPFGWAYELFASGRLAVAHPLEFTHNTIMHHGAPDGTPFLLFAELASMCMQIDYRPDFWRERFPHLVRAVVLFTAHPATDVATIQELGMPGADPEDLYAFYDGKNVAMRTVFELRRRHELALSGTSGGETIELLEDALTWCAGQVIGAGGATVVDSTAEKLAPEPLLFFPGQLGTT